MILDDNIYTHIRGNVVRINKKQKHRDGSEGCLNIEVDINGYGKVELTKDINKKRITAMWLIIEEYIGGGFPLEEIEDNVIVHLNGDRVYITKFISSTVTWDIIIDIGSEIIEFYKKIEGEKGCSDSRHLHINNYIDNNVFSTSDILV